MSTGETIYAHNSGVPFAPASNEKIPVSFAALTRLGAGYRFHTEVYGVGARAGSAWNGDLVLKGFGDPTLSSADLDRLAATIRGRGIRSVTGRVLGDESFYDSRRAAAGWKPYFLGGETPPLSALIVDRARGWPALSPPLLAARAFRDALGRRGVLVTGRPGLGVAPAAATTLASDTSDPLAALVKRMNRESDNFYAEMLLKQLAAAAGKPGTSAGGAEIVVAAMREAGIPVAGVRIVDGSGLSSLDRLTAAALVGVLRAGCGGSRDRARLARLPCRPRQRRNAERPSPGPPRRREGKDGDDEPRLHAVRADREADRIRRARDRKSGVLVGGTCSAGSFRDDPGAPARGRRRAASSRYELSRRAFSSGSPSIGTPAFSAFAAFEPGLSPTITPVVFFETESETFAPSASRAAFASSRV